MSLHIQKELMASKYDGIYDEVIPKDNILRKIKEQIDFSFVNTMLSESYCQYYGRPAKEPEMMFKLMFLKVLYDLSDKSVTQRANYDLSFKFFLGLNPEEGIVDSSLLTKFRKTRIKDDNILDELLAETIRQAVRKGVIRSNNTIIVDSTHTKSKSKFETPTQMLRKITKELRKEVYKLFSSDIATEFPDKPAEADTLKEEIEYSKKLAEVVEKIMEGTLDKKIEKKLSRLKEMLESDKIRHMQSVVDEDAKQGYKSETNSFFGYKNHIAMTEERIITAIDVTSGEASDGKALETLITQTEKNGIKVEEILGDSAYSGKDNLELVKGKEIKLVSKLNPVISNTMKPKNDGFEYNKDADAMRCPAGNISIKKKANRISTKKNSNILMTYHFDIKKCKNCSLRDGCYKPGCKSKTYSVSIASDIHKEQQAFQDSEYFKERAKERYKIEAKNAELKRYHGLDVCKYTGLHNMRKQAFFTAFVTNIKRITTLLSSQMLIEAAK